MSIPDPDLDAAVERRDLDAVVDRLSERFAIPDGHDDWVLDMLMDGVPTDVDDETRANVREWLAEHFDEIVPPDLGGVS